METAGRDVGLAKGRDDHRGQRVVGEAHSMVDWKEVRCSGMWPGVSKIDALNS
jgi:hypothetical protein